MKRTNVLVIGGGGREGSVSWKLLQSPQAGTIYVAPGNPGTAMMGCQNIPIQPTPDNFEILADIACHLNVGLVFIGPDSALASGIVRVFRNRGITTFGPEGAAVIEASKSYAKKLMSEAGIPTAPFEIFRDPNAAKEYARIKNGQVVVKANGLCLGKGSFPCHNIKEAKEVIDDLLVKKVCGDAGRYIVIEDLLEGNEISVHVLCDGSETLMLPVLRDHKRLTSDPKSPMTGGMGVHGPIDIDDNLASEIMTRIVEPCIEKLAEWNLPFVGCLYPGLMLTKDGPMVLEFNARFGDPETQLYMCLLEDDVDLIEVFTACARGRLKGVDIRWKKKKGICITVAAEGYPDNPRKGDPLYGEIFDGSECGEPRIFHCGTAWKDGQLLTNGGRVVSYTELFDPNSQKISVQGAHFMIKKRVSFHGMQIRDDVGLVW